MLIFLIRYDLRDAERVPHELPHRLGADVGVPQTEHFVISWKGRHGGIICFLRDTAGQSLKSPSRSVIALSSF